MSAIQIKAVPPDLHDALRARAAEEGLTIGQFVLATLRRELTLPSMRAWFERVAPKAATDVDAVTALHEARREREEQLARAHRD